MSSVALFAFSCFIAVGITTFGILTGLEKIFGHPVSDARNPTGFYVTLTIVAVAYAALLAVWCIRGNNRDLG